jgi:hypothetical protein
MSQMENHETRDEVLREVRRIKEALAKSMNFDIHRILEDARRRQREGGRTVLPPPARKDA